MENNSIKPFGDIVKLVLDRFIPEKKMAFDFYCFWLVISIASIILFYIIPGLYIWPLWAVPVLGFALTLGTTGNYFVQRAEQQKVFDEIKDLVQYVEDYNPDKHRETSILLKELQFNSSLALDDEHRELALGLKMKGLVDFVKISDYPPMSKCYLTHLGKKVFIKARLS